MTVEEMKERKRQLGYTYEQIATLSDVPLGTVQKVFGGVTRSPRYDTLRALEKVFLEKRDESAGESRITYGKEAGIREESYEGKVYNMEQPTCVHQLFAGEIYRQIQSYLVSQKGGSMAILAPVKVWLDSEGQTIVQPDICIVKERNKLRLDGIHGIPDMVIEVISAESKQRDSYLKLAKYQEAGVKEYWIVDPDSRKVVVYAFEQDICPQIYKFEDLVPVSVFNGQISVDFKEVSEFVRFVL